METIPQSYGDHSSKYPYHGSPRTHLAGMFPIGNCILSHQGSLVFELA